MNQESNRDYLIFDGCNTVELAKQYETPLYVVSETNIINKCREIHKDFLLKYKNTKAVYASKAFQNIEMCKLINREGLGLDVVSGGELYIAIKAGFPMENVVFHGNNKSLDELKMAISHDVGRIVVDNDHELQMLSQIAEKENKIVHILLRITPGIDVKTHKYISTGQADSKFGIPLQGNTLQDYVDKIEMMPHIKLEGFHFDIGSQLLDNEAHLMALEVLLNVMKDLRDKIGFVTSEINLGGGFGIPYIKEDKSRELKYFIEPMMKKIYEKCRLFSLQVPQVIIEPGRWIVGEAGITLYTIGSIKEIPGIRIYASVDGGMPDNPRPALYNAKYEGVIANKYHDVKDKVVTIAGKCCESGDILIWDLKVPTVEPGDILAVMHTGAYNFSMSNNYNKLPRPAVVMVKEGESRVVVRRETYEDLIRRDNY